ncbi:hypothetical protein H6G54_11185 [Anabaena cylindrica FACHB-243]|uniref:Uncharacterized protein n=1 Tax=Anabaena cylindrica (strain ATCC 27899 / PCC 7122) TaxID=272123 RepID=K9ZP44_ANACC|nr:MULTISPECIES: hypothetical protein [Anabaena]AFZ60971.1 hypothetical protein Anacy_5665 [Anabaena cylindrica PCC 7122]MBD2418255.1 hypothetical protein [Anabaena cylindrica FACHB-243]MCM2409371.1 hypothetical protein [Anabaena sp. CCAP 1446/1C]BAY06417.1 hypothetical protein NIES19_57000 [Anabaena cylindrica PCC 7122]
MIKQLFVTKKFGTYADTFLMLGLVQLAEYALKATHQKSAIQLLDQGTRYCLQLKQPINLELVAKLNYTNSFPPVKGQKTDISKIPQETDTFNTVEESERRKLYRNYVFEQRGKVEFNEDAPKPPHPSTQNGVILTSMRHDRNHNELWYLGWQIKDHYGALLVALFTAFSQEIEDVNSLVNELFTQTTGQKLPETASAVKIYLPTSVQGVNRIKADSNKVDSQKADWLSLWLIAGGLFTFGIAERVKIAERVYDWRVVAFEPQDIPLNKYREVLNQLRKFNPPSGGHGIARFDSELILLFCRELLNHHQVQTDIEPDEFDIWQPVNHFVSNFIGTHFGSKGQVYGVKEVFSLGLPGWISPKNSQELTDYHNVLNEHLSVITTLSAEEGHSELLAAYRDFLTGTNLINFFRFQVSYADYVVKRLADPKARPPRLFSLNGLNLMVKNFKHRQNDQELNLTDITEDPGFLRIAKAINSATVYAGKDEHGWDRIYGLAQRLSSQAGSKKDFIIELSAFIASYENENLRIDEELKKKGKPRRIWTTKDDLDRVITLIENHGSSLVANLLIAYGYAKGWGKSKEADKTNLTNESETEVDNIEEGESEND